MQYTIKAKPKPTELQRFWTLLNDGTIGTQEPDGHEIVASMKRAVLAGGSVEWSETCYCTPPLNHERTTVYDQFFSDFEIQPQTAPTTLNGERFWRYLQLRYGEMPSTGTGGGRVSTSLRHVPLRLL